MIVTLEGIVIESSLEQLLNAYIPIVVTLDGIVIEVNLEQLLNAYVPIVVTLDGIVIEVKLELPLNTYWPMEVYPCIIALVALLINDNATIVEVKEPEPSNVATLEPLES